MFINDGGKDMSIHSLTDEPTEIYVIADAGGNGEAETRASTFAKIVLDHGVLTVFTSQKILRDYTNAYYWRGPIQPVAYPLDPLRLANVVAQHEATSGLRSLVFTHRPYVTDSGWNRRYAYPPGPTFAT